MIFSERKVKATWESSQSNKMSPLELPFPCSMVPPAEEERVALGTK